MGQGHKKTYVKGLVAIAFAVLAFAVSSGVEAEFSDSSLVEGAKLCTRYLPRHERQYGIPVHLLAAIASTESGRFHKALGMNLPWPWTINVEGKGYFFDTKAQAIEAVQKMKARGFQSIDVGCMQVNLHHHPYAFANLDQAFDPAYNVAYAAQFLKKNFEDEGSWRKATADYHSRTPLYGEQYARLVFGAWNRIINKVADARAGRPLMRMASVSERPAPIRYYDKQAEQAAAAIMHKPRVSSYRTPHMHEISVSSDATRERGILIIRPERESAPVQQAKLEDTFVTQNPTAADATPAQPENKGAQIVKIHGGRVVGAKGQFEPDSHMIRVGNTAPVGSVSKSGRNTFVFEN